MAHTLPFWLAAIYLQRIGPRKFFNLLSQFENIEQLFAAKKAEMVAKGFTDDCFTTIQQINWHQIEKDLRWGEKNNQHIIPFDSLDYPCLLKEISDPPLVLFVLGNKHLLRSKQLAIVGARHPTPQGLSNAEQFAYALAQMGLTITSGLAIGIDGSAHRGALRAQGKTLAVAGTGLEQVYPSSHHNLYQQITSAEGAIISEFPLSTPPSPKNFPRRNRIIAGLSLGVLVIEAALKSGSLITARHALEQGREIFAVPGSIHNPLARGCHHLIRQGAKLVERADDVLEELQGFQSTFCSQVVETKLDLPSKASYILQQVEYDITPLDVIILRSGLTASEVSSILLTLELQGYVQSVAGGYIRAITKLV